MHEIGIKMCEVCQRDVFFWLLTRIYGTLSTTSHNWIIVTHCN